MYGEQPKSNKYRSVFVEAVIEEKGEVDGDIMDFTVTFYNMAVGKDIALLDSIL